MSEICEQVQCRQCGVLQNLPPEALGVALYCAQCSSPIHPPDERNIVPCTTLAAVGLALWFLALTFPLASLHLPAGRSVTANVASILRRLLENQQWMLFCVISLTLLIAPVVRLIAVLAVPVSAVFGKVPRWVKWTFTTTQNLRHWALVDVFILGAMVALIRLKDWGHINFGLALLAFAGVGLCSLAIDLNLHPGAYLKHWSRTDQLDQEPEQMETRQELPPYIACQHCEAVSHQQAGQRCPRCEREIFYRKPGGLQRTWALVIASALLIIPANVWPVLTVQHMQQRGPKTIYGGVVELAESDNGGLALLIFVASIIVPFAKVLVLSALLLLTQQRSTWALRLRTRAYRWVTVIGRWSMIDIFAAVTLYATARFGWFGNVHPERGALAFCAAVFLTMLASETFDPRLMWDRAETSNLKDITR